MMGDYERLLAEGFTPEDAAYAVAEVAASGVEVPGEYAGRRPFYEVARDLRAAERYAWERLRADWADRPPEDH